MTTSFKILFSIAVIAFLIAPLVAILPLAFTSSVFLTYPIPAWSMRWFGELVTADAWSRSIINSLIVGFGTTAVSLTLGTAASLGLRHRMLFLSGALKTLFLLPMVVPAVVLGVGMQVLFVRLGIANSYIGVIVAHTVVAIPFVVVSVSAALAGIDKRVELAAQSLGASPATALRRITFPLAMPGIISGAVLAFATSLDEVVLTLFVAGPNQRTLARQMFSTIRENISPAIAAAALILIAGTVVIGLIGIVIAKGRKPCEA
ncbi:ABC transporter permease [Rhizobium sullae]|uniref:Putative spermidine/putrescine transport system permease protein n=1 Tax=Rhizobium sullae TaxID=50338 RepID=A0A4R3PW59_RHISU|nr:ABC transporter permease [Rhizobium sullae]TCU12641.1 putative spermidine/putrescine transport system permease protein [Rhizobium sullae]